MKRFSLYLSLICYLLSLISLTACDSIAENERLIYVEPAVVPPEPEPTDEIYTFWVLTCYYTHT